MKNQKVTIFLSVIIIFLIGFIITEQNNPTANSESLFEKQERCVNNRDNAKKRLQETYSLATPYFYDIFYSSKTGTCVYTYGLVLSGVSPEEVGSFVIADYFTGEDLFNVDYDNSAEDSSLYSYNKRSDFRDMVEKYKK